MAYQIRAVQDVRELRDAVAAIGHYFGWQPGLENAQALARNLPLETMYAAFDGDEIVAGTGSYPLQLTVPGARLPCAGTTLVGVLPNHRRRGLLTQLMRKHLDDARKNGEPLAALYASQETIYRRYGFGLASMQLVLNIDLHRVGIRSDQAGMEGKIRLIKTDQALKILPRLYDRIARQTTGFLRRKRAWWETRILDDSPRRRGDAGPLNCALLERDGLPVGYALYRIATNPTIGKWHNTVRVMEAIGLDASAMRDLWRFLLEIDWTDNLETVLMPVDHPLRQLVSRVNLLNAELHDALWLRVLDVEAALAGRRYRGDKPVTVKISADPQYRKNLGCWTIDPDARVRRTTRSPDITLDIQALGAAYLGGFTFSELVAAGNVDETRRGGAARADLLFGTPRAPWTPDMF